MASGLATFLVVAGVGVGGYALYRWWEEDKRKGDHWRRKEGQHLKDAKVSGYFTGVQSGPAIVGMDYAGNYYYAGQAKPPVPDPRNCLCPMTLDPLDARLPDAQGMVKCPCSTPGAVRPPYAGYMAVGRGGGGRGGGGHGGGHFHHYQPQQDQQQDDEGDGDPQQPYMPPQHHMPPQQHMPYHHHGRR